jgi:hypothetical protein
VAGVVPIMNGFVRQVEEAATGRREEPVRHHSPGLERSVGKTRQGSRIRVDPEAGDPGGSVLPLIAPHVEEE